MKSKTFTKHLLSFSTMVFLLILAIATTEGDNSGSSESSTIDLSASISFTGTQFVINNNDDFDWQNVELDLNSGTFSSGYTLNVSRLEAGESYTVGAMQFANSDGEKFNPFSHKPLNMSISCDTPRGRGHYYGSWE